MLPVPEPDLVLLRSFISDRIPLPLLLAWIHPPGDSSAPSQVTPEIQNNLDATSPQSFALSFLHYLRAQVHPLFSAADNALHVASTPPANTAAALEEAKGQLTGKQTTAQAPEVGQTYQDEFPALSSGITSEAGPKSMQRRRVTPTQTAHLAVDTAFVLAKVNVRPQAGQHRPKRLGPRSLEVDMNFLMHRANQASKHKDKHLRKENAGVDEVGASACLLPPREVCHDSNSASVEDRPLNSAMSLELLESRQAALLAPDPSSRARHRPPPDTLVKISTVHATLMLERMVPSLLGELHFLLQLLNLETDGLCDSKSEGKPSEPNALFRDHHDCASYACGVLEQAGRLIESVGEGLLSALVDEPVIFLSSPKLFARIKAALINQQAASLQSDKAYESIGPRHPSNPSPKGNAAPANIPGLPSSLPFQSPRDSRNHFKTPEEIKVYNNREQCRDLFYSTIRQAAAAYSSFGSGAHESEEEGYAKMKESAQQFFNVLLIQNFPWFAGKWCHISPEEALDRFRFVGPVFVGLLLVHGNPGGLTCTVGDVLLLFIAEFFLEQVLQVYLCGDADPVVAGLARQDQAKLQKLHDRLTGTSSNSTRMHKPVPHSQGQPDSRLELSPSSPWSQVKSIQSTQALKKKRNAAIGGVQVMNKQKGLVLSKEPEHLRDAAKSRFSDFFPQFLRVYIWFLEVTDSYRLNSHLVWGLRAKICNLTELSSASGHGTDNSSGFTNRVLAMKAFAGLLGFLSFSPGAGTLPPVPVAGGPWTPSTTQLPLDIEGVISAAKRNGSVLLVLPWVLEFLRLSKADDHAHCQPYFHESISALRNLYLLPMLDPAHPDFGVGSVCILASLDSFFEYMELPVQLALTSFTNEQAAGVPSRMLVEKQKYAGGEAWVGLDKVPGIVDTRYIQHCCQILVEMRTEVLEGKKRRHRLPVHSKTPGRQQRKITPVQSHCQWQPESMLVGGSFGKKSNSRNMDAESETMRIKLQRNFLEQRPQLRRLVDFMVDTVAVNAASAAVSMFVPRAVKEAFVKLDVTHRPAWLKSGSKQPSQDTIKDLEIAAEHVISSAIRQSLLSASEFLQDYVVERTSEALSILVYPNETPCAAGVAAGIAAEAAGLAAQQKALARMSTEIRRQITEEVQRRKNQQAFLNTRSEIALVHLSSHQNLKQQAPLSRAHDDKDIGANSLAQEQKDPDLCREGGACTEVSSQHALLESTRQASSVGDRSAKLTGAVKRQLAFSETRAQPCSQSDVDHSIPRERELLLASNVLHACLATSGCIASGSYTDDLKNQLRQHLSLVCLPIEALLAQIGGVPAGGVDGLVIERNGLVVLGKLSYMDSKAGFTGLRVLSTPGKLKNSLRPGFRVELGLARRTVALALRFCFLSPHSAFGLESGKTLPPCSCSSVMEGGDVMLPETDQSPGISSSILSPSAHASPGYEEGHSSPTQEFTWYKGSHQQVQVLCKPAGDFDTDHKPSAACEQALWFKDHLAGPMWGLVNLWKTLIRQEICSLQFLLGELLAPWRWVLALHLDSWSQDNARLETAMHGLIGTILQIMDGNFAADEIQQILDGFVNTLGDNAGNESDREAWRVGARKIACAVSVHARLLCKAERLRLRTLR